MGEGIILIFAGFTIAKNLFEAMESSKQVLYCLLGNLGKHPYVSTFYRSINIRPAACPQGSFAMQLVKKGKCNKSICNTFD